MTLRKSRPYKNWLYHTIDSIILHPIKKNRLYQVVDFINFIPFDFLYYFVYRCSYFSISIFTPLSFTTSFYPFYSFFLSFPFVPQVYHVNIFHVFFHFISFIFEMSTYQTIDTSKLLIYQNVDLSNYWHIKRLTYQNVNISKCWLIKMLIYQPIDKSQLLIQFWFVDSLIYRHFNMSTF